eukprot:TRINITY_DN37807_c0_g1_i1.p1 TRINITY_DN37807_c0_g1~~TRINITY_DN37807_c0_g1_i1.p1  ORF type:complete len:450 (+),score=134.68 TRINITY_DN37807_c0_g1_i1:69-1352(+)
MDADQCCVLCCLLCVCLLLFMLLFVLFFSPASISWAAYFLALVVWASAAASLWDWLTEKRPCLARAAAILLAFFTFPVSLPVGFSLYYATAAEKTSSVGRQVAFNLVVWSFSIFGGLYCARQLCIPPLGGSGQPCGGDVHLPRRMLVRGRAVTFASSPAFDVFPADEASEAAPRASFNMMDFPRCSAPGAPFEYDQTIALQQPDGRAALFADRQTVFRRGFHYWDRWEVRDCDNAVQYRVSNMATGLGTLYMHWEIEEAGSERPLASAIQSFTLAGATNTDIVFRTFASDGGAGEPFASASQKGCVVCLYDEWEVGVNRTDVVPLSVFGFIITITRHLQLVELPVSAVVSVGGGVIRGPGPGHPARAPRAAPLLPGGALFAVLAAAAVLLLLLGCYAAAARRRPAPQAEAGAGLHGERQPILHAPLL